MTMYRRFCCNDLLRLAPLNLESYNMTHDISDYTSHLVKWPANCYVSYLPGGQITGYIFATIEGTGLDISGRVSLLSLAEPMLDPMFDELVENACDKIYNASSMKMIVPADDNDTMMECEEIGYKLHGYHEGNEDNDLEFRKPLKITGVD